MKASASSQLPDLDRLANWPDSASHWADVPGWGSWDKKKRKVAGSSATEKAKHVDTNSDGSLTAGIIGYMPGGSRYTLGSRGLATISGYSPPSSMSVQTYAGSARVQPSTAAPTTTSSLFSHKYNQYPFLSAPINQYPTPEKPVNPYGGGGASNSLSSSPTAYNAKPFDFPDKSFMFGSNAGGNEDLAIDNGNNLSSNNLKDTDFSQLQTDKSNRQRFPRYSNQDQNILASVRPFSEQPPQLSFMDQSPFQRFTLHAAAQPPQQSLDLNHQEGYQMPDKEKAAAPNPLPPFNQQSLHASIQEIYKIGPQEFDHQQRRSRDNFSGQPLLHFNLFPAPNSFQGPSQVAHYQNIHYPLKQSTGYSGKPVQPHPAGHAHFIPNRVVRPQPLRHPNHLSGRVVKPLGAGRRYPPPPHPPAPASELVAGNPFAEGDTLGMEHGSGYTNNNQRRPFFLNDKKRLPFLDETPDLENNSLGDYDTDYDTYKDEYLDVLGETGPLDYSSSDNYDFPSLNSQERRTHPTSFVDMKAYSKILVDNKGGNSGQSQNRKENDESRQVLDQARQGLDNARRGHDQAGPDTDKVQKLQIKDALVKDPYNIKNKGSSLVQPAGYKIRQEEENDEVRDDLKREEEEREGSHKVDGVETPSGDQTEAAKFELSVGLDLGPNFSSLDKGDFPTFTEEEKRFFEQAVDDDTKNLGFEFDESEYDGFHKFNFDYEGEIDFDSATDEEFELFLSKRPGGGTSKADESGTEDRRKRSRGEDVESDYGGADDKEQKLNENIVKNSGSERGARSGRRQSGSSGGGWRRFNGVRVTKTTGERRSGMRSEERQQVSRKLSEVKQQSHWRPIINTN